MGQSLFKACQRKLQQDNKDRYLLLSPGLVDIGDYGVIVNGRWQRRGSLYKDFKDKFEQILKRYEIVIDPNGKDYFFDYSSKSKWTIAPHGSAFGANVKFSYAMEKVRTILWHMYTYREVLIDEAQFKQDVIEMLMEEKPEGWMNWHIVFGLFEAKHGVVFVKKSDSTAVAVDVGVKEVAGFGGGLKVEVNKTEGLSQAYVSNPKSTISPVIKLFPVSAQIKSTSQDEDEPINWNEDPELPENTFLEPAQPVDEE